MEIYRVTASSPVWMKKAYDYVRTDAFCFGQSIPIELEFGHDTPDEQEATVLLVDEHKPIAGCRLTYPEAGIGKIGRVCVVRERQRTGIGHILIAEAEKWLQENGVNHIVINSQDRAAPFYERLGYKLNPDVDPRIYEHPVPPEPKPQSAPPPQNLGFRCVLVEKYL